jgi:hypothetical protein
MRTAGYGILFFLLAAFSGPLYGQFRTSFGLGLDYFLGKGGGVEIHSVDMVIQNQSAYIIKNTGGLGWGVSIHSALLFRNPLLPETSHFVIYDFSMRTPVLAGPFIDFRRGPFEGYCAAGLHLLFTLIRHNEASASLGNSYLERFELNTGAGVDMGLKFHLQNVFFNLGVVYTYDFLHWMSYVSKFGDYAGWEYSMTGLRPYLLLGFSLKRREAADEN